MSSPKLTPEPTMSNDFGYPSHHTTRGSLSIVKQTLLYAECSAVSHGHLKFIWEHIAEQNMIRAVGEHTNHTG